MAAVRDSVQEIGMYQHAVISYIGGTYYLLKEMANIEFSMKTMRVMLIVFSPYECQASVSITILLQCSNNSFFVHSLSVLYSKDRREDKDPTHQTDNVIEKGGHTS